MISIHQISRGWNRFFFEPISPITIAFYRIFLGTLILVNLALILPDFHHWFGIRGSLTPEVARTLSGGGGLNLLNLLPATDASAWVVFWLAVVASITLAIGFFTRTSAAVAFVCMVTLNHRNTIMVNSGDSIIRIMLFFLVFSQAGAAYSIDRLIRVARGLEAGPPKPSAPWAMRLISIQIAFVYLYTFVWKAMGGMWLNGTALYYTARLTEFWRFPLPYFFEHMWAIKLATWGTLILEFSLGVLVWIKEFRYWVLLGGVLLHVGIDYTMNIPLFGPIMMASYITFVDPVDLERVLALWKRKVNSWCGQTSAIPVFYDGKCSFCIRTLEVVKRLDTFGRFSFHDMHSTETKKQFPSFDPKRGEKEMLVHAANEWLGGFKAFRYLARHMPLLWPLLPILHLPKMDAAGGRVYSRIAGRRYCLLNQSN